MTDQYDDSFFNEQSEMSSFTMDWGKVGDHIVGVFVKSRHGIETQFGENSIYEFYAHRGSFHKVVNKVPTDEVVTIKAGESYSVWGRNDVFNGQLNSLVPGQVVKLTFTEEKKTKMGMSKIIKIYAPKDNEGKPLMDESWLNIQSLVAGGM